jgi:hypothetical protein
MYPEPNTAQQYGAQKLRVSNEYGKKRLHSLFSIAMIIN